MSSSHKTSIAIIGGGEIGLTTSILLSLHGIQHVLLERQPTTSIFPKAIGLHNRTMEILRKCGLEEEILKHAAPPEMYQRTTWLTSLDPEIPKEKRVIEQRKAFGYVMDEGERGQAYRRASPGRYVCLAQLRLEPILRKRAEELNPKGIWFHCEATKIEETDDGAVVTFHSRSGEHEGVNPTIEAQYVIGADGGRFVTEHMGMHWDGQSDLADLVTAHIRAPLSLHTPDPGTLINWFINPRLSGSINSGLIYHLGPYTPPDPRSEEWSVVLGRLPHERHKPFTKEDMLERMHKIFCLPGLEIEVLSLSHWMLQAKAASSYISPKGRVFLVGDAAHRVPPWGALGGNTGFQDMENLVWKLALALKTDEDLGGLLRSYDSERRPVGQRVAKTGLQDMMAHTGILDRALGVSPTNSEEENVSTMDRFFDDAAAGEAKVVRDAQRQAVRKAANETLDIEFFALGAEAGWFYDLSDICDNEECKSQQINEDGSFETSGYRPCTVPGHQLPHAWLTNSDGHETSTRWLVKRDKFLLLTSSRSWGTAKHPMIDVVVIGEEWHDEKGEWAEQRGVTDRGAMLVRPDNIVAYRWQDGGMLTHEADLEAEMARVVRRVLKLACQ